MSIEQNEKLKPPAEMDEKIAASTALSQDALSSNELTGRHHHGHGGIYPYPYPMPHFEPPVTRISVSPPGHVVPSVELTMGANKDAAANKDDASLALADKDAAQGEEVGRHHHGGYYPYPYPMPHYEPPASRISVSPPGHVVPSVELVMGANKDAMKAEQPAAEADEFSR